ncbi:MAG TPA: hypothetical protein VG269_17665 [Tepidisphaeraceae bacterium]|jgi:hypothetical protein|nr:hypothetical protein [Tepidisphaeraceae bacterium]
MSPFQLQAKQFKDQSEEDLKTFRAWSDRCDNLKTANSKVAQWLNRHPGAKYGKYVPPGTSMQDPNKEAAGVNPEPPYKISRPSGVMIHDAANSVVLGVTTTGHAAPDTDPNPAPNSKDFVRTKGTSRQPIDTATAKNATVDAQVSAAQTGAVALADATDEVVNGLNKADVIVWSYGEGAGQIFGFYVKGLNQGDGCTIINQWTSPNGDTWQRGAWVDGR